jgi:site-specific DNA recombinase
VLNIMAAVSQWEREAIGECTRDAMRHKRNQGERVGNIAFGSRLAGHGQHLEQDPAEQAALGEIRRLRGQGTTLRGIAAALNQRGLPNEAGKRPGGWKSVARVLKQGRVLSSG